MGLQSLRLTEAVAVRISALLKYSMPLSAKERTQHLDGLDTDSL